MKNFEKFINAITLVLEGRNVDCGALLEEIHAPWECDAITCEDCHAKLKEYLLSEYEEPVTDWSKVAVDTPILVSDDGEGWLKRCFAKFKRGKVYVWSDGRNSWTTLSDDVELWEYAKLAE